MDLARFLEAADMKVEPLSLEGNFVPKLFNSKNRFLTSW
jgi:hypothetical protein